LEVFALANKGLIVPKRKKMEGKLKKKNVQRRNIIVALSFIIIVVAAFFIYKNFSAKNDKAEVIDKSIAVLPFVNMSNDKNQEYFSDGLSEELLNLLSKTSELKVIGRTSSFSFKGKNEDLRIIAEKLGVAHILEGSVRKDGNKIRVTAQLIRATDGSHLWSEAYDRDLEGIFKLQDEIAFEIVKQLKLKLIPVRASIAAPINTESYNLLLQGNFFAAKRDSVNVAKAVEFYRQALAIDSSNARVWAVLADGLMIQATWKWIDTNEGYEKVRKAATKAIDLNGNSAEAHKVLGDMKLNYDWDWEGAETEFRKALTSEPQNPDVLRSMGALARTLGRLDESLRLIKQSIALDPVKSITYLHLGFQQIYANHLEDAILTYKKILELNPQFPMAHTNLGEVYLLQGKPDKALTEIQQELSKRGKGFGLAMAYRALQRQKEAEEALRDYIAEFQGTSMYMIAEIYAFFGDKNKAFEWLEKAYTGRDVRLTWLKGDPLLKNLEGDPRHEAFMKKMNLPLD
jgi:TolB-like protein/Flp pilus assembly protein TadD